MPEIEFVEPDFESGPDEELVTGPRHAAPPAARGRKRMATVAALAALAGAALVAVLVHGGGSTPTAAPTLGGANVLAPEAPASAFRVDHLGADAPEGARPGTLAGQTPAPQPVLTLALDCPNLDACEADLVLPPAVSEALQARLPGVSNVSGSTVSVKGPHPTLRSRQITARAGRLSVRIDIETAAGNGPQSRLTTVGAGANVSATAIVRGFAVIVTISGPDTLIPGLPTVEALAADRRLLVVS